MFFAGVAILINLSTQVLVRDILRHFKAGMYYKGIDLIYWTQLISGTIIGFVFKFLIDKFFIFKDIYRGIKKTLGQFYLYTGFAVFTTIIFWGTETVFKMVFNFKNADITGGFIGLVIGYTTKYLLDRTWVFNRY